MTDHHHEHCVAYLRHLAAINGGNIHRAADIYAKAGRNFYRRGW